MGKTLMGTCAFCGQTRMIDLSEEELLDLIQKENKSSDEIADDIATRRCTCREGSDWRADRHILEKAKEDIESMFREEYPEIADLLQEGKELVYFQKVKRINISTCENGTAAMSRTGSGIKIKFVQKTETELLSSW